MSSLSSQSLHPSVAPTQRILIVDDDREIVRLVRAYLEQAGYQVFTAYDGESALHTLRRETPALLVLDLMLPDRDGWDITRICRSDPALKNIPIIMLTARVEDTDKIVGLELGADDYVTKPFNPREVVARVRSVLRRTLPENVSRQQILQVQGLFLDINQHQVFRDGEPVELTPTEFKLLRVFMENPGYAFPRSELAEQVLGFDSESLERTLDSHIKNLRRKVENDPAQPTYIHTVYGIGYRFVGNGG
ncbi:MAG: response regulator transcription factor [Anaerolineae bacterium]|nr:response regulator transcription factor [Anaerolineae bacterium]